MNIYPLFIDEHLFSSIYLAHDTNILSKCVKAKGCDVWVIIFSLLIRRKCGLQMFFHQFGKCFIADDVVLTCFKHTRTLTCKG